MQQLVAKFCDLIKHVSFLETISNLYTVQHNLHFYLSQNLGCSSMECQIRKNAAGCKLNDTFIRITTFLDKQMLFDFRKVVI